MLAVVPQRTYKLSLNRATGLIGGPAAWTLSGGLANAGKDIKIAIIDTGAENTIGNPALRRMLMWRYPY